MEAKTGSRLHFGLFASDDLRRRFGGLGLMIERPGVEATVSIRADGEGSGPVQCRCEWDSTRKGVCERAAKLVEELARHWRLPGAASLQVRIASCPPEHHGLGVGTQLSLAIAAAFSRACGREFGMEELAELTGRGRRSAVGKVGFDRGGLIFDSGHADPLPGADGVRRIDFPDEWRVAVVVPTVEAAWHGRREEEAFARLQPDSVLENAERGRRLAAEILQAVENRDAGGFGEAVYEYNLRAGAIFESVQGGPYSDRRIAELIDGFRRLGVAGTGQSSWGPAVFAIDEDGDRLAAAVRRLSEERQIAAAAVTITRARNRGAAIRPAPAPGECQ